MLLIQIAGGVVLVFLIVAFFVRGRVTRHERPTPKKSRSRTEFRPTLPPSPYQPSRGFRILDGTEPVPSPPVQPPRLDPRKEFVFNDTQLASGESISPPQLRHDEKWALDRSMRHAPQLHVRRRRRFVGGLVTLILAAGLIAVLWLGTNSLRHSPPPAQHHSGLALVTSIRTL